MIWTILMEEGRGGFMDSGKYREVLTDLFWYGKVPEETAEQHKERLDREAQEAKESIGQRATPAQTVDELRAMSEALKARGQRAEADTPPSKQPVKPKAPLDDLREMQAAIKARATTSE